MDSTKGETESSQLNAGAILVGTLGAFAGLYLAVGVVGPVFRSVFGTPHDFNQDFSSRGAWFQAKAVQFISLAVVFFLVGMASRILKNLKSFAWSLWAANPLSIGVAYLLFQRLFSSRGPGEYFGYASMAILAVLGPIAFAPAILLGRQAGMLFGHK